MRITDSEKLDLILQKVGGLDEKVDSLDEKVGSLDERVSNVESEMQEARKDVRDIKLLLENEIRVSIQRVAEGHLDLSRNMHEVMKPNNEIEMLAIRIGILETDMRELKQKVM